LHFHAVMWSGLTPELLQLQVWMSWLQTRFSPIFLSGGVYLVMIYYGVMMVFVVVIVDCMCPSF
jgi:hypothetical protein